MLQRHYSTPFSPTLLYIYNANPRITINDLQEAPLIINQD